MAYTDDEKIPDLDIETTMANGDYVPFGDVSDSGRAKAITLPNFITKIVNYINTTVVGGNKVNATATDTTASVLDDKIGFTSTDNSVQATKSIQNSGANEKIIYDLISVGGGSSSGGGGTKIDISTTEVTVSNTTVETTLFTIGIPASTLGTDNGIRYNIPVKSVGMANTNAETLTIRVKYGATTVNSMAIADPEVAFSGLGGFIGGVILADGTTSAQKGFVQMLATSNSGETVGDTAVNISKMQGFDDGTATEDSSTALDLVITAQWSAASASNTITAEAIVVEQITDNDDAKPWVIDTTILGASSGLPQLVYMDTPNVLVQANSARGFKLSRNNTKIQMRDSTTDWADVDDISSFVVLGNYLYVLMEDTDTVPDTFQVWRYLLSDVTSTPTQITFGATNPLATTNDDVRMTTDGTNFYFTYLAGNSANSYAIGKYTLSGTVLTYSSTITLASTPTFTNFIVKENGNIFILNSSSVLVKYSSAGVLQTTADDLITVYDNGLLNYSDTVYGMDNASNKYAIIFT